MLDLAVLLISILAMGLLGLLIVSRNPRNVTFRIFGLLTAFSVGWDIVNYLSNHIHNYSDQLFTNKLSIFLGYLLIVPVWLLSMYFPKPLAKLRVQKIVGAIISIVLLFATLFTAGIVASVTYNASQKVVEITTGSYYIYSLIISLIFLVLLAFNFYRTYSSKEITPIQKQQIQFVSIGLIFAYVWSLLTAAILPGLTKNWAISKYSAAGSLALVLMTSYAIIRHRLFDIKLIVARAVAYTLTITSLAGSFVLITYLMLNIVLKGSSISRSTLELIYTLLAVVLALTFPALRYFFNKLTNRLFYKDSYEPQIFLDEFNKVLVSNYELHPLLNNSLKVIAQNLNPDYSFFGIKETSTMPRLLVGTSDKIKFADEDIEYVRKITPHMNRKIIIVDELEDKYKDLQEVLRRNDVAIVARIATDNEVEGTGYLIMGPKKSGNIYSKQDIQVIEILANELVIAIQNSLRFEEIQSFNATLQQKVNDATYKLRKANERLKILDETKDDFISMASHQLRTPLTSIKGYISMILEGDAGKINHTQHDMLGQAFFSSQRMVYLIADMLNVSRLKTGKFAIENNSINLADVVEQEMEQLKETAEAHGVKLSYKKPKDFPDLLLDETKIRQVVMNFADNAIYYTPKGGNIVVELKDNPGTIELHVIDDGIGVPKSERHHLFTKFYRAGNARKVRPDGTGLGLYMAKKVIMAQGGSLVFESEEGKGSNFGFIINKTVAASKGKPSPTAPKKVHDVAKV